MLTYGEKNIFVFDNKFSNSEIFDIYVGFSILSSNYCRHFILLWDASMISINWKMYSGTEVDVS